MKLFAHQQKLVDEFPKRHALVWGTGSGKTLAFIALAIKSKQKAMIIVPKGLKTQWEEQVKMFGDLFFVITKETFRAQYKKLPKFNCVGVDECHHFLGTDSAMMKSLRGYFKLHDPKFRYMMTATPYRSSPYDIMILSNLLGFPIDRQRFTDRFFSMVRMGPRYIPVPKKNIEEDIAAIVHKIGSTVRLEECVDVPEQTFEVEWFSLTEEQEKAMKKVDDLLPIQRFTAYHQICGGTRKGDEYDETNRYDCDKVDRILNLAETNTRMIVSCRYNEEINMLYDRLESEGHKAFIIRGDVVGEDRHRIVQFLGYMETKKEKYVLLVNAACCEGWELPRCPLMVFYSLDFSLVRYVQMIGRIQRINNIKKNTYIFLVEKETIDEDVYEAIKRKESFHLHIYCEQNA